MVLESRAKPHTRDTHRKLRHSHILPLCRLAIGRLFTNLASAGRWPVYLLTFLRLEPDPLGSASRCLQVRLFLYLCPPSDPVARPSEVLEVRLKRDRISRWRQRRLRFLPGSLAASGERGRLILDTSER